MRLRKIETNQSRNNRYNDIDIIFEARIVGIK